MIVSFVKKCAVTYALLLVFSACGSMKHSGKSMKIMPGTWQATTIIINGDCTDWPSPYPNYDSKAMVAYATSNDASNLYITMQTGDPLTQIKILKQGVTVTIDTTGRKDGNFHISFPLQNDDDLTELFAQGDRQKKDGTMHLSRQFEQKLQKSADGSIQFSLEGFGTCSGTYMVSQSISCGVQVKVRIDEYKQLVWEAVVPFRALYGTERIMSSYAGKPISVCFAVKGFKGASTKSNDNSAAAPMNNGMGGGGLGAGGRSNAMPIGAVGGGGGNTTNPLQRMYESTKTWKHFALAWQ